ncbi:MAG TPA: tetratricopeptide repeat protein, partial [Nannocystaceae bacterium]|nr:tetratricopeptide repeat protein [Nannocystaceae bacterium]
MSAGNPKHVELPPVVVPPHLWLRSERPTGGRVLHFAIPGAFFVAGLLAPTMTSRLALIGSSVIFLVLIPALIQHYLEVLGTRVASANRVNAAELKRTLRGRPMVSLFAPQAWVALQEAQLALRLGDGQTAAKGFAETARLCKRPDAVMLISAQAHALVVAGDRKAARELLDKLAAAKLLGPRDQLDLGIVMLLESHKRSRQAMAYVEAARKTIGEHPRVIAAMALGLQRAERIDEAAALLEKAQISLQEEPDAVVEELVNRARRDMRRYIEAQLRRERRARSRRTTVVVTSEHAVSEIVSGEIASRGDSGASPRAGEESKDGVSSAVADALADSEALRSRGWQDPSAFAGKSPEETQPKVKVELRDPSLGEPIRIEKSYTLKPKPKSKSHKVASAGPAIDIDLADDGADTDEVESSEAIEKTEAGEAVAEPSGLMTPPLPTVESKPGGLAAAIRALVQGGPEAPAPAAVVE